MNFIKIPNKYVWNNTKENSIKYYNKNVLYILSYLLYSENKIGYSTFSIEKLITRSGLNVNRHKGKSLDNFISVLNKLIDNNVITCLDLNNIKIKDYIECKVNIEFDKNNDFKDTNFFTVEFDDFNKIMTYEEKDKITLLNVYYYMLARCGNYTKELESLGGRGNYFFDNYDTICEELNISNKQFFSIINELQELKLIYYDNIGMIKNNRNITYSNNVYARDKLSLKEGLKCSKEYWNESGYEVVVNINSEIKRKIKGYKGQIAKNKNQGKSIKVLENKLHKLEKQL